LVVFGVIWKIIVPNGRDFIKWVKKRYEESLKGKTVVFLIPSRTDTKFFHDFAMKADDIRFIKGRLKFDNYKTNAPFPSMIVVFRGDRK